MNDPDTTAEAKINLLQPNKNDHVQPQLDSAEGGVDGNQQMKDLRIESKIDLSNDFTVGKFVVNNSAMTAPVSTPADSQALLPTEDPDEKLFTRERPSRRSKGPRVIKKRIRYASTYIPPPDIGELRCSYAYPNVDEMSD